MSEKLNAYENMLLCGSEKIDNKSLREKDIALMLFDYKDPEKNVYEKNLEKIRAMAEYNCEANFVTAVINQYEYYRINNIIPKRLSGEDIKRIGKLIDELGKQDYQLVFIRNFIRCEIIRYNLCEDYYYGFTEDKGAFELKNILIEVMELNTIEISNNCWYPIRNKIQHIILELISKINSDNLKAREYSKSSDVYREVKRIASYYEAQEKNYALIQKCMMEILDIFRIYMPGSMGHLLWLYYYVGDLLYYQMSDESTEQDNLRLDSNSIKGNQPEDIRNGSFEFNIEDLDRMFNEFVDLSESWISKDFYSGNPAEIKMYLTTQKSFECKKHYKRLKKILKRNKCVREYFYNVSGNMVLCQDLVQIKMGDFSS